MKKLGLILLCGICLIACACSNKEELAAARLAFETHFEALIANDMQTLGNTTSEQYRTKFFNKESEWNTPEVIKISKALNARFNYEILEIKQTGKDILIKAHLSKVDYNDMESKVTQAIANTDVEAFQNAGYSQEEFDSIMFNRMLGMIQRGNFKIKEADIHILMVKEADGWKVDRDLIPEKITDDWF